MATALVVFPPRSLPSNNAAAVRVLQVLADLIRRFPIASASGMAG